MDKAEVILHLINICRTQVILASRKKHKLRIYEDMLERIEKIAVASDVS